MTRGAPKTAITLLREKGHGPFSILVATIISLRTKEEVTIDASLRLLAVARTPQELLKLSPLKIEQLIYPCGFYKKKSRTLLEIAQQIMERWEGEVPSHREGLLSLSGVGLKTANLVLGVCFGIPALCVDTHVHRVANRLGLVRSATPDATEGALCQILPRQYWIKLNDILVLFGKYICTPISPYCSRCLLRPHCPQVGVLRNR